MFKSNGKRLSIIALAMVAISALVFISLVVAQGSFFQVPGGGMVFDQSNPVMRWVGKLTFQSQPGGTKFAMMDNKGHFHLSENSTLPVTSDLSADAEFAMGVCNDKLYITYNNGGTVKYLHIPLDDSSTTWTHGADTPGSC